MRFCVSSSAIFVGVWPPFRLNVSKIASKKQAKRDQTARCNIASASWVSRFGMFEARVLLAFRAISLAFSQTANPTHSVIRALVYTILNTSYGIQCIYLIIQVFTIIDRRFYLGVSLLDPCSVSDHEH